MKQQALVVDDHPVVRNGIKQLLHRAFPSMFIKESSGTDGVIEEICGDPWSFVTLDLSLPGGQNGLHIIRQINSCCPQILIIVFSLFSEEEYGPRALVPELLRMYPKTAPHWLLSRPSKVHWQASLTAASAHLQFLFPSCPTGKSKY